MVTAKEARKLAQSNRDDTLNQELKRIEEIIDNEIVYGSYTTRLHYIMSPKAREILVEMGYKVYYDTEKYLSDTCTIIEW